MKHLSYLVLLLVFLGAGCLGGGSKNTGADAGVFKTADAGTTWTQVAAVPTAQGIGTLATTDVLNLEIDPSDKFVLYAGTRANGLVSTEDGAASWRLPRQSVLRDGTVFNVQVDPNNSCHIYAAKGNRLYETQNCGRSFEDESYVETRGGVTVAQIAVDWYNKGTVWIGLSNGDVLKSIDNGKSWRSVLKVGEEVSEIMLNNKDSRQVIVSSYTIGMQRTLDGGDEWRKVEGGLSSFSGSARVYDLSQTADGGVLMAATQYGLVRSKDFGSTWEALNLLTTPGQVTIRSVGVASDDPNTIYYATPGTFYRTNDAGQTWQTQKFPSARVPRAIVVDPDDAAVLYVGVAAEIK